MLVYSQIVLGALKTSKRSFAKAKVHINAAALMIIQVKVVMTRWKGLLVPTRLRKLTV
jgi:hypothetical protein